MTPEEKINYALSLEADKMLGVRSPRIDALISAALRLAQAAQEIDNSGIASRLENHEWQLLGDLGHALDAFLALLPEPPKEDSDAR